MYGSDDACALRGLGVDGASTWKLAFTVGLGQKPRQKTVTAQSTVGLLFEIKAAKKRFGLPEDVPVLSCYEAGRNGFWLHRFLLALVGVQKRRDREQCQLFPGNPGAGGVSEELG